MSSRTTGAAWMQTVASYTTRLIDGPNLSYEEREAYEKTKEQVASNFWKIRYVSEVRAKHLRPLLSLGVSVESFKFLMSLIWNDAEPPFSCFSMCCCRVKEPCDGGTDGAVFEILLSLLEGNDSHVGQNKIQFWQKKRTPLGFQNPGEKAAYLLEIVIRLFSPYPDAHPFPLDKVNLLRRRNISELLRLIELLLDPQASFKHNSKFSYLTKTLRQLPSASGTDDLESIACLLLHGLTISDNYFEASRGIAIKWCHSIAQYKSGVLLQHMWRQKQDCDGATRPVRAREGQATAHNVPRFWSNIVLSGALQDILGQDPASGLPGTYEISEWITRYWFNGLEQYQHFGEAYPTSAAGVDAHCMTLQALIREYDGAADWIFKRENLKFLSDLFNEDPTGNEAVPFFRNSIITLWDAMTEKVSKERAEALRYLRIPATLEKMLLNKPYEGEILLKEAFVNRTFIAAKCLATIVGHVSDHPFLLTCGHQMQLEILNALPIAATRYSNPQKWSKTYHQGLLLEPRIILQSVIAFANTTSNKTRIADSGGLAQLAKFLQTCEIFLSSEIAKDAGSTLSITSVEDDLRYLCSALYTFAESPSDVVNVIKDLKQGFECDVDIEDVLEKLVNSSRLSKDTKKELDATLIRLRWNYDPMQQQPKLHLENAGSLDNKVFLSYTSRGSPLKGKQFDSKAFIGTQKLVAYFHDGLEQANISTFFDKASMGSSGFTGVYEIMRQHIAAAEYVIVFIEHDYIGSAACLFELQVAIDLKKKIIPIFPNKFSASHLLSQQLLASLKTREDYYYEIADDEVEAYKKGARADPPPLLETILSEIIRSVQNGTTASSSGLQRRLSTSSIYEYTRQSTAGNAVATIEEGLSSDQVESLVKKNLADFRTSYARDQEAVQKRFSQLEAKLQALQDQLGSYQKPETVNAEYGFQ